MNYLIGGLFFCLVFGFAFLELLQYVFLSWQDQRLRGQRVVKAPPQWPQMSVIFSQIFAKIAQIYDGILTNLTSRRRPKTLVNVVLKIEAVRKSCWQQISRLVNYFESLGKSKNYDSSVQDFSDLEVEDDADLETPTLSKPYNDPKATTDWLDEVDPISSSQKLPSKSTQPPTNFIAPVSAKSSYTKAKTDDIWANLNTKSSSLDAEDSHERIYQETPAHKPEDHSFQDTATIGLIGSTSTKSDESLTLFEKAEKKLIQKLQELGLNHWDLWLELGDLYGKYDQKAKQKEIYTLILSKADGKEKELATYRLIGMN